MRMLICKDLEQGTLLESRVLKETANITYEIIENAPIIEELEGFTGAYVLVDGELQVAYTMKPKTEIEQLKEEIETLKLEISNLNKSES